ncbi:hypothetical protein [Aequorivita aquimaris]|jgi:hypothetical protein|uniref:hypothetical protein n=1 Tax=Aequorivita aquimaris TaxID=1548749 RepID=UPI0012FF092A|nr:hypothetical protein [Aequorivita aquimaris]
MKKIILINALIWAALLLSTAILFKGHANVEYSFFGILIAYSVIHTLLANFAKGKKEKC